MTRRAFAAANEAERRRAAGRRFCPEVVPEKSGRYSGGAVPRNASLDRTSGDTDAATGNKSMLSAMQTLANNPAKSERWPASARGQCAACPHLNERTRHAEASAES